MSLAELAGPEPATAAAARVLAPGDLAPRGAVPAAARSRQRRRASRRRSRLLKELRDGVAAATEQEPEPLERLVRVRARTLVMIATLTGAFYFLLPQLANVDDSVDALRSANWGWLAGAIVMSGLTYVAAAVGMAGGVSERLPLAPTVRGPDWRRRSSTG